MIEEGGGGENGVLPPRSSLSLGNFLSFQRSAETFSFPTKQGALVELELCIQDGASLDYWDEVCFNGRQGRTFI